ncbi:hypothetical protein D3C87_1944790 [compost metagenome]
MDSNAFFCIFSPSQVYHIVQKIDPFLRSEYIYMNIQRLHEVIFPGNVIAPQNFIFIKENLVIGYNFGAEQSFYFSFQDHYLIVYGFLRISDE